MTARMEALENTMMTQTRGHMVCSQRLPMNFRGTHHAGKKTISWRRRRRGGHFPHAPGSNLMSQYTQANQVGFRQRAWPEGNFFYLSNRVQHRVALFPGEAVSVNARHRTGNCYADQGQAVAGTGRPGSLFDLRKFKHNLRSIGQINGLLRVAFLTDTTD